jgi:hypothetical protein
VKKKSEPVFYRIVYSVFVCLWVGQMSNAQGYRPTLAINGEALAVNMAQALEQQNLPQTAQDRRIWVQAQDLRFGRQIVYPGMQPDLHNLEAWVLAHAPGSVDLESFYQKCFELSDRNIQRGLVLAWNFLSHGWEEALERNSRPESLRLMDITGESSVYDGSYHYVPVLEDTGEVQLDLSGRVRLRRVVTKRGDNRGAWYHFAGTALAAYTYSLGKFDFGVPRLTYAMIWLEKFFFRGTSGIANQKRIFIDKAGADFGFHLRQAFFVQNGTLRLRDKYKGPRQEVYVDRPDLFQDPYALEPGQRPQQWGSQLRDDHPIYQSLDYFHSLIIRHFRDDILVLNPIRLMTSSEGDRFIALLKKYGEGPANAQIDELLAELVIYGNEFQHEEMDLIIVYKKMQPERKLLVREKWKKVLELILGILQRHGSPDFLEAQEAYLEMRQGRGILGMSRDLIRQCRAAHAM